MSVGMPRGEAPAYARVPGRPGPPASGVDELLAEARRGLSRLSPEEAAAAVAAGALLVDTRTERQRAAQGELPGAVVVDRTVLEWRLDPTSPDRIPEAGDPDLRVVVVCRQGYSSSLAAASLQRLGLHRATDVIGGVEAWVAAGLPVHRGPADVRD
jgi:rhodanese-related sulfurtransferase